MSKRDKTILPNDRKYGKLSHHSYSENSKSETRK